jgi:hypothetical protein
MEPYNKPLKFIPAPVREVGTRYPPQEQEKRFYCNSLKVKLPK